MAPASFPRALATLLKARGLTTPSGLLKAPPEAYAGQDATYVQRMAQFDDANLLRQAERIAGYAKRQATRAKQAWDASPVIRELRSRDLPEPPTPKRPVAAAISLKVPVAEWSDTELLAVATEWSARAMG